MVFPRTRLLSGECLFSAGRRKLWDEVGGYSLTPISAASFSASARSGAVSPS